MIEALVTAAGVVAVTVRRLAPGLSVTNADQRPFWAAVARVPAAFTRAPGAAVPDIVICAVLTTAPSSGDEIVTGTLTATVVVALVMVGGAVAVVGDLTTVVVALLIVGGAAEVVAADVAAEVAADRTADVAGGL